MRATRHPDAQAVAVPPVAMPAVIPGLDGLRAISILLVMVSHSGAAHLIPGVFGVTLFFFISGFLITSLMIAEQNRHGHIGIGSFYLRRLIRLYPPLIASIAATVIVAAFYGEAIHPLGIVGALAYLANYLALFQPQMMAGLGGQLWSLAVEEHFYLVYPLLMLALLPRPRLALAVLGAICAVSLACRIGVVLYMPEIATDYTGKATECRIDSILYGALAAFWWWTGNARAVLARHGRMLLGLSAVLLLIGFAWRNGMARDTVRYTIQGLALVPAVLAVTVGGLLPAATRLLEAAPVAWIGRLSYSLYLWHLFGFELAARWVSSLGAPLLTHALGWVLVFAVSMASYRFIEKPFFALRRRFGSNVAATAHGGA